MVDDDGLSVLLVEDNPGDANLLEHYFTTSGFSDVSEPASVTHVTSLSAAVDAVDRTSHDVAFLDLGLPESSGVETVRRFGEVAPELPVIVLTGLDDRESAIEAIQEGAQDYLVKNDVDGRALARSLRYALERHEQERELQKRHEQIELFHSIVRHDIRNEANFLLDLLGQLCSHVRDDDDASSLSSAGEDYLARANDAGSRIADLTEVARDTVAALSTSADDLEAVPLEPCLREQIVIAASTASDATVETVGEIPAVDIRANDLLSALFRNLLSNAFRHNTAADPHVAVSVRLTDDRAVVTVADDGEGVVHEPPEGVFRRGVTAGDREGAGFGLYFVRTLVDQYGGDVRITDADPHDLGGATFVVELPLADDSGDD